MPNVTRCDDSGAATELREPILSRAAFGFMSLQRVNTLCNLICDRKINM